MPDTLKSIILHFGKTLGRFDIEGQVQSLEYSIEECNRKLAEMDCNKEMKLRNYKTLGLCAGAALAILFV